MNKIIKISLFMSLLSNSVFAMEYNFGKNEKLKNYESQSQDCTTDNVFIDQFFEQYPDEIIDLKKDKNWTKKLNLIF